MDEPALSHEFYIAKMDVTVIVQSQEPVTQKQAENYVRTYRNLRGTKGWKPGTTITLPMIPGAQDVF